MVLDKTYKDWLIYLKDRINSAQLKAATSVNKEMIKLYWDIGKSIFEKQEENKWGSKIVENLAHDLKKEFPDTNGFSRTNLFAMRKFYLFFKDCIMVIVHHAGGLLPESSILCNIPWRHQVAILSKCDTCEEPNFYMEQTNSATSGGRNSMDAQYHHY